MEQTSDLETSRDTQEEADAIPEVVVVMVSKMSITAQQSFWYQYLVAAGIAMTIKNMNLAA